MHEDVRKKVRKTGNNKIVLGGWESAENIVFVFFMIFFVIMQSTKRNLLVLTVGWVVFWSLFLRFSIDFW